MSVLFISAALMALCPPNAICVEYTPDTFCLADCNARQSQIDLLEMQHSLDKDRLMGQEVVFRRKRRGLISGLSILSTITAAVLVALVVEETRN